MNLEQSLAAPGACLMVVAPHPDDESLAAGGMIQRALEAGARVHIVFVTEGDNNPWPQRMLEHRLRIGPRERERWAARRREEARQALRELGAETVAIHRLQWPDGGVTAKLVDETPAALEQWRGLLEEIRPTLLVVPDLADRHPDHSALHVLLELVLQAAPIERRPLCLCYLLHGRAAFDRSRRTAFPLTPQETARKRAAILAHRSQIALSRGRLMRFASDREWFATGLGNHAIPGPRLPWKVPRWAHPAMALFAVDPLGGQRLDCDGAHDAPSLLWRDGTPAATLARPLQAPCYVKLYSPVPSPWVFDVWGWKRFNP
ncbi:MAG TPA: PIG-L family deacetylase [Rhodanobacteraceae bacterium]|nr:PIG-L family deacetylase [Rhodanobacteraceae bacterium]